MSNMRSRRSFTACKCSSLSRLSAPLLFLSIVLPATSYAQITSDNAASTSSGGPTPPVSTSIPTTLLSSISTNRIPSSLTTSFTSHANATTSSASSTMTMQPPLFPGASDPSDDGDGDDPQQTRREGVFNYYFLFLALFGVVVAIGLWWIHRRKKRRKEQQRLSGQNALARDLDGWVNTRRWMHGAWRHNRPAGFVRREEGLNENGEAPPPYEPKVETTETRNGSGGTQRPSTALTIPTRTLSRDEIESSNPPEYRSSTYEYNQSTRPDTASTRPETAEIRRNTSVRELLRNDRA